VPAPPYGSRGAGEDGNLGRRGGGSGSLTFTSLTASNQWLVPPAAGFGFGGAAGRPGFPVPGNPCPDGFCAVGGTAFAASFSFLAFCTHSGQVTSFALADWNHLPQVVQRILILLMRGLPCNIEILLARILRQGDCVGMHLPVYHRVQLIQRAWGAEIPRERLALVRDLCYNRAREYVYSKNRRWPVGYPHHRGSCQQRGIAVRGNEPASSKRASAPCRAASCGFFSLRHCCSMLN
jgi:hypothetical protein